MTATYVPTRRDGGPDLRGSSRDRRARKQWLLDEYGDGTTVQCCYCPRMLTMANLTVERVVPGWAGGRYTRDNIQPACMRCNTQEGAKTVETPSRTFASPI